MTFAQQVDDVVEKIIDAAIDYYMYVRNWQRYDGGNYVNSLLHGWEITPPGNPVRSNGGECLYNGQPKEYAFEYGSGTDAGTAVYRHFENTIQDLFQPWRRLPDPADFNDYLNQFAEAAHCIALTSKGDKVAEIGNDAMTGVSYLRDTIVQEDMNQGFMQQFAEKFVYKLPIVIHGQYAVILLAGTTLCGEQQIWEKARPDLLAIADKMREAMENKGGAGELDLSTIIALFNLIALFPGPQKPMVSGASTVLSSLDSLVNNNKNEPTKPPVEYGGDSPEDVIGKAKEGLKKLAETIKNREDALARNITGAMETITSHSGSFDVQRPTLLNETDAQGFKVDLELLKAYGESTLPSIATQLNAASDMVANARNIGWAFYRPSDLGTGDDPYGPMLTWSALVDLAENLPADLAWEVSESGKRMLIASQLLTRTEAEIEAEMNTHKKAIENGSGFTPIDKAGKWLEEHS